MTKKIFATALCATLIVAALVCFSACDEPKTTMQLLDERVSSRQTTQYTGQTEDSHVSVSTQEREKVFVADGEVGDKETVTAVIVTLPELSDEATYSYVLQGADGKVEGALTRSVIGNRLVAKIENADALGTLTSISVTSSASPEAPTTFELTDEMQGAIAPEVALQKAYEHFKTELDAELASEDGLQREIYLRFVNGKTDRDSEYYWYVSFIADRNDEMSVLLDPVDGSVVTSRVRP